MRRRITIPQISRKFTHDCLNYPADKETNKQVRQQACKTQIPPYGLTRRRRPQFRLPHCDFYIAHPGSNAAAVTPREPKFTKMGEDLSG